MSPSSESICTQSKYEAGRTSLPTFATENLLENTVGGRRSTPALYSRGGSLSFVPILLAFQRPVFGFVERVLDLLLDALRWVPVPGLPSAACRHQIAATALPAASVYADACYVDAAIVSQAKQKSTASKQKQIEQLEKPEGFSGFFRSLSTPNKEAEAAKMVQLTAELEACKISELDQEQATINFNETALTEFADFGAIRTARNPIMFCPLFQNLLEDTGGVLRAHDRQARGRSTPSAFSWDGSMLPSSYADGRSSDDVIAL